MLLTIFVPTNTSSYILNLIDKFNVWGTSSTELLIAVNGVNREIVYNDLVIYINTNRESNINIVKIESDNLIDTINHSISYINGEYVTLIGNDDSFLYAIEDFVEYARLNSYDAITYTLKMIYFWPKVKKHYSRITISNKTNFNITCFNPKIDLGKLIYQVGQNYRDLNLVNFYHGIVKKSLIEKSSIVCGNYVGGFSPDIYFAYTLSNLTERVMKVEFPLTIPGIGIDSASHSSMRNSHQSELYNSPIKNLSDIVKWNSMIPKFYSVETVWAATLLIAHEDMFKKPLVNFNFKRLYLLIYLNNSLFRKLYKIDNLLKNINFYDFINISKSLLKLNFRKIKTRLLNRVNIDDIQIKNLDCIASDYFPVIKYNLK